MRKLFNNITQEDVKVRLHYDPNTGIFIRLKNRGKGKEAGTINMDGYRVVTCCYTNFMAHRLAWFYVYGKWPKNEIDHINGDTLDNRISNLREATRQENAKNQPIHKHNISGVSGVHYSKRYPSEPRPWIATISLKGKKIWLGQYSTKEKAIKARRKAEKNYYKEFLRI